MMGSWPSGKASVLKTDEGVSLRGFDSYTPRQPRSDGRAVRHRFAKPATAKARAGSIPARSVPFTARCPVCGHTWSHPDRDHRGNPLTPGAVLTVCPNCGRMVEIQR